MTDLEQRARALLAAEYEVVGMKDAAHFTAVDRGMPYSSHTGPALRAIIKALSREAELESRIEATRGVIEGGYPRPLKNGVQCAHGKHEWEDCIGCYDEALFAALYPRSTLHGERAK